MPSCSRLRLLHARSARPRFAEGLPPPAACFTTTSSFASHTAPLPQPSSPTRQKDTAIRHVLFWCGKALVTERNQYYKPQGCSQQVLPANGITCRRTRSPLETGPNPPVKEQCIRSPLPAAWLARDPTAQSAPTGCRSRHHHSTDSWPIRFHPKHMAPRSAQLVRACRGSLCSAGLLGQAT